MPKEGGPLLKRQKKENMVIEGRGSIGKILFKNKQTNKN